MVARVAKMCPVCGAASVNSSSLVGGDAQCRACGWHGKNEELYAHRFETDFVGTEAEVDYLFSDLRVALAAASTSFGRFLAKWGFLDVGHPDASKVLARYMARLAREVLPAVIAEREAMEKERVERN